MKYRNGKLTKKWAIELAVLSLYVSISNGDIQNKEFDDALEVLEKHFNINKLYADFFPTIEEFKNANE
jgi:hypothetical protein